MNPHAKIDEGTRQAIIDTYTQDRLSVRATAYLCAVSQKTVCRVLKAAGVKARGPGEWKKIDRDEVARLRRKKLSQRAIADILDCSPSGVRRVLQEIEEAAGT